VPSLKLDSPRLMDSTGALDLPDIPKTLLVIGGGYIGLELGSVYATLGSKVTCVEMMPACCRRRPRPGSAPAQAPGKTFLRDPAEYHRQIAQGREDGIRVTLDGPT